MFTCLYVHNPDLIEEPALKAFALGILKVCDIAREKVNKAAVFEEVSLSVIVLCPLLQIESVVMTLGLHFLHLNMCGNIQIINPDKAFTFYLNQVVTDIILVSALPNGIYGNMGKNKK